MFIFYALIPGIIIGYLRKGRLKNLLDINLRWVWLVLLSFVLQWLIFSDLSPVKAPLKDYTVWLHFISYIALLVFTAVNVKTPGIELIGVGTFLNALVIFINGGYMPTPESNFIKSATNINHNTMLMTPDTMLPWLGDIFRLPRWLPLSGAYSIGDVAIGIGLCLYFAINMKPSEKITHEGDKPQAGIPF